MKKILVPTDFSPEAMYALELANEISKNDPSTEIIFLNVIEKPSQSTFSAFGEIPAVTMDDLYILRLIDKTRDEMFEIIAEPKFREANIKVKISLQEGYNTIADEICAVPADLIIVGSEPVSGMEEFFIGSTAEKVVRLATCPVITVKSKPDRFKIENMVFASTFKEDIPSIDKLKGIQQMFSATLHLLYVDKGKNAMSEMSAIERMKYFAAKSGLGNYTVNVVKEGNVERGINKFALDINADVIVMATHARKGLLHFIMGSLTENIVNHSNKLMLTFHMNE